MTNVLIFSIISFVDIIIIWKKKTTTTTKTLAGLKPGIFFCWNEGNSNIQHQKPWTMKSNSLNWIVNFSTLKGFKKFTMFSSFLLSPGIISFRFILLAFFRNRSHPCHSSEAEFFLKMIRHTVSLFAPPRPGRPLPVHGCGQSYVFISVVLPSQNGIHCSQRLWTITFPKTSILAVAGGREAPHSCLF